MMDNGDTDVLELTAKIVSAHVGHNHVAVSALPELIQLVYFSLTKAITAEFSPTQQTPAVSIDRSVFPDYVICLEDGKKLKMLKRHLRSKYGMTPELYRQKWGLPASYPLVAPNYASYRSILAKQLGIGRKPENVGLVNPDEKAETPDVPAEPMVTIGRARRARGSRG